MTKPFTKQLGELSTTAVSHAYIFVPVAGDMSSKKIRKKSGCESERRRE